MEIGVPPPEMRFRDNAIDMIQYIHDIVKSAEDRGHKIVDPKIISTAGKIMEKFKPDQLIQSFIDHSHNPEEIKQWKEDSATCAASHMPPPPPLQCPVWDQIYDHNDNFFIENAAAIFKGLPGVDSFKLLYTLKDENGQPVVGQEHKDGLWDFFESYVRISIRYIHAGRGPAVRMLETGVKKPAYTLHFFDYVNIEKHCVKWDVELQFKTPLKAPQPVNKDA